MKNKRKNQGTLHSNVVCAYSEPGKSLLTVSTAPIIGNVMSVEYIKLLFQKEQKMIQRALTSKPASTVFSAKLRHGLAWHPSSTLNNMIAYYLNFLFTKLLHFTHKKRFSL